MKNSDLGLLIASTSAAFGFGLFWARPEKSEMGPTVGQELVGTSLKLVDAQGRTRVQVLSEGVKQGSIGGVQEGDCAIEFFDPNGKKRAAMAVGDAASVLSLTSPSGESGISFRVTDKSAMALLTLEDHQSHLLIIDQASSLWSIRDKQSRLEFELPCARDDDSRYPPGAIVRLVGKATQEWGLSIDDQGVPRLKKR